jgi:hypothetical protein
MPDYDIRVIDAAGGTSLFFVASFASDDDGRQQTRNIARERGKLEIWRGLGKIEEIASDEKTSGTLLRIGSATLANPEALGTLLARDLPLTQLGTKDTLDFN